MSIFQARAIEMWKQPTGNFKIKAKKDIDTLFECLSFGGRYVVNVNKHHIIRIKKDKNGSITVIEKTGNLFDLFNPELVIPDNEIIDYLYKYRKALNNKFFNDKEI